MPPSFPSSLMVTVFPCLLLWQINPPVARRMAAAAAAAGESGEDGTLAVGGLDDYEMSRYAGQSCDTHDKTDAAWLRHTHIHPNIHTHVSIYTHTYMHTHASIHTHIRPPTHTRAHTARRWSGRRRSASSGISSSRSSSSCPGACVDTANYPRAVTSCCRPRECTY